jgi:hypothetical protein
MNTSRYIILATTYLFCIAVRAQKIELNLAGLYLMGKPQFKVDAPILENGDLKQFNKGLQVSAVAHVFKKHVMGISYHFMHTEGRITNTKLDFNTYQSNYNAVFNFRSHAFAWQYRYDWVIDQKEKVYALSLFPTLDMGIAFTSKVRNTESETFVFSQSIQTIETKRESTQGLLIPFQAHLGAGAAIAIHETIRLFAGYKFGLNRYDLNQLNTIASYKINTSHSYLYMGCGLFLNQLVGKPKTASSSISNFKF